MDWKCCNHVHVQKKWFAKFSVFLKRVSLLNPWVRTNLWLFLKKKPGKSLEVRFDFGPRPGFCKQLFGSSRKGTALDWTCFKQFLMEAQFGKSIFIQGGCWEELCSPYAGAKPQPNTGYGSQNFIQCWGWVWKKGPEAFSGSNTTLDTFQSVTVCLWDKPSLSLGQSRGRPKGNRTQKFMFMCLFLAWEPSTSGSFVFFFEKWRLNRRKTYGPIFVQPYLPAQSTCPS